MSITNFVHFIEQTQFPAAISRSRSFLDTSLADSMKVTRNWNHAKVNEIPTTIGK